MANAKLNRLVEKETFSSRDVAFILDSWEDEDFPRKLNRRVRMWFKEHGWNARYAELQTIYAPLDERSAHYLTDPCVEAQNAILKFKDADDIAYMVKKAVNYSLISPRLWKLIVVNIAILSARAIRNLAAREDAPRSFVRNFGTAPAPVSKVVEPKARRTRKQAEEDDEEEVVAPKARRTRKSKDFEEEAPVQRGKTGSSRRVHKQEESPVEDDDDYSFDEEDDDDEPAPKKTVKKSNVAAKVRQVAQPAKKIRARRVAHSHSDSDEVSDENDDDVDDFGDDEDTVKAARTVRRPRR